MSCKIPIWLDCDPGHDDAFAILLAAHHPDLTLLGMSTVHGNASLAKTTLNALSVLESIGRPEVPVFPGAKKPICRDAHAAPDIHGVSGIDGTNLLPMPKRMALYQCNAVIEMRDAIKACPPDTAWIVATGTLTNVALLFAVFPDVACHIKGLSIMGGAIGNGFTKVPLGPVAVGLDGNKSARIGNVTPFAEFNIWCDPEAAQSIFSNNELKAKTTIIPLDLTHLAFANKSVQDMLRFGHTADGVGKPTRLRQMYHELLMFFAQKYSEVFGLSDGPPLHDPVAVAVVLAESVDTESRIQFETGGERWDVSVELAGDQVGRTRAAKSDVGITIPRSFDLEKFWHMLDDCMARADRAVAAA